MKPFIVLLTLSFILQSHLVKSQKVLDKISKSSCDCFKKIDLTADTLTISNGVTACLANSILKNGEGLKKEYGLELGDPELMPKIQGDLMNRLFSKCDVFIKVINSSSAKSNNVEPNVTPSDCELAHIGKFRYVKTKIDSNRVIEFTKDKVLEYDEKGQLVTESKIKWLNDCEYTSTLISSTNQDVLKIFKVGETMRAKIIRFEEGIYTYDVEFKGVKIPMHLKPIK